jgi:CHAD domain-containing protein
VSNPDLPTTLGERLEGLTRQVHEAEQMVRDEHAEGVHDLRVAMRRTRSLLTTFKRELGGPDRCARLKEELRWAGGELSPVRDLEVVHERIESVLGEQRVELVLGGVQARLDDHVRRRRPDVSNQVRALLGSERWRRILTDLDGFGREPATGTEDDARRRLRKDWRRLRRRARRAARAVDERAHETALHAVRKAAKRARYAAETLGPLFGDDAARMEVAAEAVQQSLGDHRDTLLSRRVLRELGVQAHLDGDNGFTFGRLHALEEAAGSAALAAYEEAHALVERPRLRRWLR